MTCTSAIGFESFVVQLSAESSGEVDLANEKLETFPYSTVLKNLNKLLSFVLTTFPKLTPFNHSWSALLIAWNN